MMQRSFVTIALVCIVMGATSQNRQDVIDVLRKQIFEEAAWALTQQPVTVTAASSSRSAGTVHDFFSEGDYWWPDPGNPEGPYIQKDGLTNPDNFTAHRLAMIRFSKIIGALSSAWILTHDSRYVRHAKLHLDAWFLNSPTKMNPHLLYAQAIKGRATGRGIGIIDTIQLMEVAQGALVLSDALDKKTSESVKNWFVEYTKWLMSHPYGVEEMNAKNNHGTCWVMQVASFARLTNDKEVLDFCRQRFKTILIPDQMAYDGSFPLELKRTKPYGYSIFNLDAMTMICQILSDEKDNLWKFETTDGRSIRKAIEFLYPFIESKSTWPYAQDVMYWDNFPVAQPSLVFGSIYFKNNKWMETWKRLDHQPTEQEVIRNLPIRHPLLWLY